MADVDGNLVPTTTFDPVLEQADGAAPIATTFDPQLEPGDGAQVFNSTVSAGGGAVVVRENPELTRSAP